MYSALGPPEGTSPADTDFSDLGHTDVLFSWDSTQQLARKEGGHLGDRCSPNRVENGPCSEPTSRPGLTTRADSCRAKDTRRKKGDSRGAVEQDGETLFLLRTTP